MLLAVDIGNSAIKFGLFEGEKLTSKFSIPTNRNASAGDLRLAAEGRVPVTVDSSIVCSVVPDVDPSFRQFISETTSVDPIFVDNSFDFGLKINYEPLESLGTDRLVNAFSAVENYGAPCIVCSLGTATTIDVVNDKHEFIGGVIAPGLEAMAEGLHLKAPRLPHVQIEKSGSVLANSTVEAIRSGIFHGYIAMVDGLIKRIQSESGVARVIASGGTAEIISDELGGLAVVDQNLVLDGLRILQART